jgi:hypothetical protein
MTAARDVSDERLRFLAENQYLGEKSEEKLMARELLSLRAEAEAQRELEAAARELRGSKYRSNNYVYALSKLFRALEAIDGLRKDGR